MDRWENKFNIRTCKSPLL